MKWYNFFAMIPLGLFTQNIALATGLLAFQFVCLYLSFRRTRRLKMLIEEYEKKRKERVQEIFGDNKE